jgi:Fe-S cluster assembly scaffold protein SufB
MATSTIFDGNTRMIEGDLAAQYGVVRCRLDEARVRCPAVLAEALEQVAAYCNEWQPIDHGWLVDVAAGAAPPQAIEINSRSERASTSQQHTVIVVHAGARASIVDGCSAPAYSGWGERTEAIDVVVLAGAELDYTLLRNVCGPTSESRTASVWLAEGAAIRQTFCTLGSASEEARLRMTLGSGSSATLQTLVFASVRTVELTVDVAGEGSSIAPPVIRLIAKQGGRIRYSGNGETRGLLLDDESRIEAPGAVGASDATQLTYLRSRGIGAADAGGMLAAGFARPVLASLPPPHAVEVERVVALALQESIG